MPSFLLSPFAWRLALAVQVLVIAASVTVVAFITLLQAPLLRSPVWLPALGAAWLATFAATMTLQAQMPLPDIHRFRRLFPDSGIKVGRRGGGGCGRPEPRRTTRS